MVWIRLADDFTDHPKLVTAGPLAGWLWVCSLAYSNRYLTDGFVPSAQVRRLADVDEPYVLADKLVTSGLWERAPGGFLIHDYLNYQPSAESVKAERQATADRVAAWRERHRDAASNATSNVSGNAVTNADRNAVSTGPPYPDPVPDLNPDPAGITPQTPRKRGAQRSRRSAESKIPTDPSAYTDGPLGRLVAERMAAKMSTEG